MLSIENVTLSFFKGTINEKIALSDLSLKIPKGQFVTVIGGNGAGKSTLMQIISGSARPDCGKVQLDGEDLLPLPEYKRAAFLGRVFQDPMQGTSADLTIAENMALSLRRGSKHRLLPALKRKERQEFKEQLSRLNLGLEDRLNVKVGLLSGGQRQALTLVMAVMRKPRLLLLDEHTAALDPKTAATVMEITEDFVKDGNLSTLMITHNMHDALKFGDRLIMLQDGKIIIDVEGKEKKNLQSETLLSAFTGRGELLTAAGS